MTPNCVLVIEDNEHDSFFIGRALANLTPKPIDRYAVNLEQAFTLMEECVPDLVFLDLALPYSPGGPPASDDDIVRFTRTHAKATRIIVLSQSTDLKLMSRLQKAGIESWWQKDLLRDPVSFNSEIYGINILPKDATITAKLDAIIEDQAKLRRVIPLTRVHGIHISELTENVKALAALIEKPTSAAVYQQGVEVGRTEAAVEKRNKLLRRRAYIYGTLVASVAALCNWWQIVIAFMKGIAGDKH